MTQTVALQDDEQRLLAVVIVFGWCYVNYAPVTVGGLLLIVGVWWLVRAPHTFQGPLRNVEFDHGAGIQ